MNGAVSEQLLVQKATNSHPETLFAKRGTTQRYYCGIQQYVGHTGKGEGHRRLFMI